MIQQRKNFVAHFIILPTSLAYSSMVGQLVTGNLEGSEKKQLAMSQACCLNGSTTGE